MIWPLSLIICFTIVLKKAIYNYKRKRNIPIEVDLIKMLKQSEYNEHSNWHSIKTQTRNADVVDILINRPEFASYFNLSKLPISHWSKLLNKRPEFITTFEEYHKQSSLPTDEIAFILQGQPSLFFHFDLTRLTGNDWSNLLSHQPILISHCDFTKLTEGQWINLIKNFPAEHPKFNELLQLKDRYLMFKSFDRKEDEDYDIPF
jgi:hypothetical protein